VNLNSINSYSSLLKDYRNAIISANKPDYCKLYMYVLVLDSLYKNKV